MEFWKTSSVCSHRRRLGYERSILRVSRSNRSQEWSRSASWADGSPWIFSSIKRWSLASASGFMSGFLGGEDRHFIGKTSKNPVIRFAKWVLERGQEKNHLVFLVPLDGWVTQYRGVSPILKLTALDWIAV